MINASVRLLFSAALLSTIPTLANAGLTPDEVRAYQKAMALAATDDLNGQYLLGLCYATGRGVEKNLVVAVELIRKAAEKGSVHAECALGVHYEHGIGVTKDLDEAIRWYIKAAAKGDDYAQNRLGDAYLRGEGVPKSHSTAMQFYRQSAEQGNAEAQFNLGNQLCVHDSRQTVTVVGGKVPYKVEIDDLAYFGGSTPSCGGTFWYRQAAERGHTKAQCELGRAYENGHGVAIDHAESAKWYHKAASQGDAFAQWSLGSLYARPGTQKDLVQAYAYLSLSLLDKEMTDADILRYRMKLRSALEKEMTDADILRAEQRTKELQKEIKTKLAAK